MSDKICSHEISLFIYEQPAIKAAKIGTKKNLYIQDHGNPVEFRNIWMRKL